LLGDLLDDFDLPFFFGAVTSFNLGGVLSYIVFGSFFLRSTSDLSFSELSFILF
jgi:hypothetical protein